MRALVAALTAAVSVACGSQAPVSTTAQISTAVRDLKQGQVVDGVPCLVDDLPPRHLHVHLTILLDGNPVAVPAGIGVGKPWGYGPPGFISTGACFGWIHTHDTSGVVHVFTQQGRTFSLGQVFAIWGRPLAKGAALGYQGTLAVLSDGRPFDGDPTALALTPFEDIVLELGKPPATPPRPYRFGAMSA